MQRSTKQSDHVEREKKCSNCNGTGYEPDYVLDPLSCWRCDGVGYIDPAYEKWLDTLNNQGPANYDQSDLFV